MSGANYSDLQTFGALQELYADSLVVQQNVATSVWNFIRDPKEGEVKLDGQGWNVGVTFALNESFGSKLDGERLPDAGYPKSLYAKYNSKLNYSTMEMTSFAATRGYAGGRPDGTFIESTIQSTFLSMLNNMDSEALGNGFGYRATIRTATPAATSFTVEFSGRLRTNMILDWYDSTYTIKRGSIRISDKGIDPQSHTVYIDTGLFAGQVPAGATAGDVLIVYNDLAPGAPADGRGISGLARGTDASVSLGGLSPANYAWWMPTNINFNGQSPNELGLQQHVDNMYSITGLYPDKCVISPDWRRAYMAGFLTQRMFTSNNFQTGAASLSFSATTMGKQSEKPHQIEFLESYKQDPTQYYLWVDDALCKASDNGKDIHIADDDGTDFRYRRNYDTMSGFMRYWGQFIYNLRRGVGRGYGFAQPSGSI